MWKTVVARLLVLVLLVVAFFVGTSRADTAEAYNVLCWPHYNHYVFDLSELREDWHAPFYDAAERWNNYADVYVNKPHERAKTVRIVYTDNIRKGYEDKLGYALCGIARKPVIVVNAKRVKDVLEFQKVIVHEMGHVLGLDHTALKKATMYPKVRHRPFPHSDDIAGLRAIYGMHPDGDLRSWATRYHCPEPKPDLQINSRGKCVRELQEMLNRRGYGLATDGIFGPKTRQAVMWFQDSRDLNVNGKVSTETWNALWVKPAPKPDPAPTSDSGTSPEPEPKPEPEPDTTAKPTPKPEESPNPEPEPEESPTPTPEPETSPTPTPTPDPAPKNDSGTSTEPADETDARDNVFRRILNWIMRIVGR